jgi:hypothetical protein
VIPPSLINLDAADFDGSPAWCGGYRFECTSARSVAEIITDPTEPPVILIAQDQSTSIKDAMSKADSTAYMTSMNALYDKLSKKYTVRRIGFGEEVKEVNNGNWPIKPVIWVN